MQLERGGTLAYLIARSWSRLSCEVASNSTSGSLSLYLVYVMDVGVSFIQNYREFTCVSVLPFV